MIDQINFQFSFWDSLEKLIKEADRVQDFQFSFWDSLGGKTHTKVAAVVTFNSLFEIPRNPGQGWWSMAEENFQFSFWDSVGSSDVLQWVVVQVFQFSFWDSCFDFQRFFLRDRGLSILFLRFERWRIWRIRASRLRLSILFLRFVNFFIFRRRCRHQKAFNSLFEIPLLPIEPLLEIHELYFQFSFWDSTTVKGLRGRNDLDTFNSLFEIHLEPSASSASDFNPAFNSLFEIRIKALGRSGIIANYLLSILFLRFSWEMSKSQRISDLLTFNSLFEIHKLTYAGYFYAKLFFQFSFWDSPPRSREPCIGKRRRLSILFLRFSATAMTGSWRRYTFNSLFEIPDVYAILKSDIVEIFQFSFWDSCRWSRPSPWSWSHTFNSLFEIPGSTTSSPRTGRIKTFNSLFEIRHRGPLDRARLLHFQFSFWDSPQSANAETQHTARLSILFLRF